MKPPSGEFVKRVTGDSMECEDEGKSIPHGSKVIIKLDESIPELGEIVFAIEVETNQFVLREYGLEGDKEFLKPFNPDYPVIDGEFIVLGKMIGFAD